MSVFVIYTEYCDDTNWASIFKAKNEEEALKFINQEKFQKQHPDNITQYTIDAVIKGKELSLKTQEVVTYREFVFGD